MNAPLTEFKMPFAKSEFERRLDLVRLDMSERGLDAFIINTPENIYYLSGYETPGIFSFAALVIPLEGPVGIITRGIEVGNVQLVEGLSIIEWNDFYFDVEDPIEITARRLRETRLDEKRIGVEKEAWFLSADRYQKLEAALPQATFVNASDLVEQRRLIKSSEEIKYQKEAAVIVEKGVQAALDALPSANTENDVAAAVFSKLILSGSEYSGSWPHIAAGYRGGLAHSTWHGKKLKKGDVIYIELPGVRRRYHAALLRNAVIGKPDKRVIDVFDATRRANEKAISLMYPGRAAGEVADAARAILTEEGYGKYFTHRTGYSIGIAFPPTWSQERGLNLVPGSKRVLMPNMVFHVITVLIMHLWAGIGVSSTVLITENGHEILTPNIPKELFVI